MEGSGSIVVEGVIVVEEEVSEGGFAQSTEPVCFLCVLGWIGWISSFVMLSVEEGGGKAL